jgi:hypothetical protein
MAISISRAAFRESHTTTVALLGARARRYRCLVIAVPAVIFVSVIWAAIQWSPLPFLALLSLPFLCGLFFSLDALSVNRWRTHILSYWLAGRLDIDDFCYALTSMKHLPTNTVAAMLASLPTRPVPAAPGLRQGLAATLKCIHSCQVARIISTTVGWAVGTASVAAAIISGAWVACFGVLLVVPVLGAGGAWRVLQLRRWRHEIRSLFQDSEALSVFVEAAARLDWESIKERRKSALLRSLIPESSERGEKQDNVSGFDDAVNSMRGNQ